MNTNAFRHTAYLIMEKYRSESPDGNNYDMYFLNILLEFSYWKGPTIHRIYFPDEETEGSLTSSHLPLSFSVL